MGPSGNPALLGRVAEAGGGWRALVLRYMQQAAGKIAVLFFFSSSVLCQQQSGIERPPTHNKFRRTKKQ
jgi:hypothetical protein